MRHDKYSHYIVEEKLVTNLTETLLIDAVGTGGRLIEKVN